jgi:hypothetical protein
LNLTTINLFTGNLCAAACNKLLGLCLKIFICAEI